MALSSTQRTLIAGGVALGTASIYATRYAIDRNVNHLEIIGDDYFGPDEPHFDAGGVSIEIDAPAAAVWPHIKQMGQDRAGWYSFELLERLFTFDIHNHYTIHPEWQDRQPGQFLFYHQPPLGIGSDVIAVDEGKRQLASASDSRKPIKTPGSMHLLPPGYDWFAWTWNFGVFELPNDRSLFLTKAQVGFEPFTLSRKALVATILGFPSYFMLSRQCDVLKSVAEGRRAIDTKHV